MAPVMRRPAVIRWTLALIAVVASTLSPQLVSATPAQSVGDLRARAEKIAADLQRLRHEQDSLNEDFLDTQQRMSELNARIAENQAAVDEARAALGSNESQAKSYAIKAYLGGGAIDPVLLPSTDTADASRRRAFLQSVQGDRQQVIDDVLAAQQDLADREKELNAGKAELERIAAQQSATQRSLEASIAEQERLSASVQGELAEAVRAEAERLEAARIAEAQRQAKAEQDRQAAVAEEAARAARARNATTTTAARNRGTREDDDEESDLPRGGDGGKDESPVNFAPAGPLPAGAAGAVQAALTQQGVPYRWAGASPSSGFDCSGLIMWAYAQVGRSLPHSSRSLRAMTQRISEAQLQPGDLVFGGSPVHHVGLYIGNGQMVHAPHTGDVVKVSGIYSSSKPVSFGRL